MSIFEANCLSSVDAWHVNATDFIKIVFTAAICTTRKYIIPE